MSDNSRHVGPPTAYCSRVRELAEELESRGFAVDGRASKAISDALRWECNHGRVYRRGRGVYGPASMPRSTEYRIHQRVMALRARATRREPDRSPTRPLSRLADTLP